MELGYFIVKTFYKSKLSQTSGYSRPQFGLTIHNFDQPSTSWASYLSSLNPYYAQPATCHAQGEEIEEEMSLYALLGRPESEQEKHLLSIGAIPAYMLGLGAGVGFVLVHDVLGKSLTRH